MAVVMLMAVYERLSSTSIHEAIVMNDILNTPTREYRNAGKFQDACLPLPFIHTFHHIWSRMHMRTYAHLRVYLIHICSYKRYISAISKALGSRRENYAIKMITH